MLKPSSGSVARTNALVQSLVKATPALRTVRRRRPRDPSTRVDIVNESLCDDIVGYLSPTLNQHKGCTLIDLQPGACLFSQKLHEFLKPEWHLLVEPDDYYFEPFIKPLLDQPNSKYRYTNLDIAHSTSYWTEFRSIQGNPALLPPRPALPNDDPKRRQFDPSVLIVGNLSRRPPSRTSTHSVQPSKLMLYQMGQHVLSNQYLQNAGLVRMLLWVPEVHKTAILAVLPWQRTGFNIGLDMGFSISEAVSVTSLDSIHQNRGSLGGQRRSRNVLLNSLNEREVERSARKNDIYVPADRELQISNIVGHLDESVRVVSPLTTNVKSVAELYAKIKSASSHIEEMHPWIRAKQSPKDRSVVETLEFPQVAVGIESYTYGPTQQFTKERNIVLADLTLRLINVEANLKNLEDEGVDRATLEDLYRSIHALNKDYSDLFEKAAMYTRLSIRDLVDDQMAYFLSPSVLTFYERSYEPLKAEAKDFWPENSLSLFDFMPKARDLSVPVLANSEEATRFCADLLSILLSSPGSTLPQALDRVGVNAAQDLIPMVPAITDARKGGRLDPNNVRVRMVTEEMVEGLVKAFFEWPFRPQSWELALASDSPELKQEPEAFAAS